jgi:hypothetical protein
MSVGEPSDAAVHKTIRARLFYLPGTKKHTLALQPTNTGELRTGFILFITLSKSDHQR